MPQFQLQRHEQIFERAISRVVARTDLSDVADSSTFKHVIAAFAREIDEAYFQMTRVTDLFSIDRAVGEDLDERAKDIQPGTLTRLGAARAVGTLIFSRVGTTGDVTIPTGTLVKTADNVTAKTTIQGAIFDGSTDSLQISAQAEAAGVAGNVAPATLIKFGSKIPGVDSVSNPVIFTGGRSQESDDSFRTRLKAFVRSLARSTVDTLEFISIGVVDVLSGKEVAFSHVFEDPIDRGNVTLYVDDGAGTAETTAVQAGENVTLGLLGPPADSAVGGEEFLFLDFSPVKIEITPVLSSSSRGALTLGVEYFLNPANGLLFFTPALAPAEVITAGYTNFTGLLAEVQKVVDGLPSDRANFPGFRAAGVLVRVLAPVIVVPTITGTLVVAEGFTRSEVVTNAETNVQAYVNNLGISGDVVFNEIINRIMSTPGVLDVGMTSPTTNFPVLDNQIARVGSGDIDLD